VKSLSPSHEQLKTGAKIVKLAESDENVVLSVGLEIRNIFGQWIKFKRMNIRKLTSEAN
jgi:hypothetical protein